MTARLAPVALVLALATAAAALAAAPGTPKTERVSVASSGVQGDRYSFPPSLSGNGRFVVFASSAESLDRRDTNGVADIFLHDRKTGKTERVNLNSRGKQANEHKSGSPSISSDGRYVAFRSKATNLAPGDKDTEQDVFVRDVKLSRTTLVTPGERGGRDPVISGNGRFVAFQYDGIFVRDLKTGKTTRVTGVQNGRLGPEPSFEPSISGDGRFVAFHSRASDLVPGDTNYRDDVFVRDLKRGVTTRISVNALGGQADGDSAGAMISADGRFVAFASSATGLVAGDTGTSGGVFLRDLAKRTTKRISVSSSGVPSNLGSFPYAVSGHGEFVVFASYGDNLVPDDTNEKGDVFIRDVARRRTTRISLGPAGEQANGHSDAVAISADGRFVGFHSQASNLVSGDTNHRADAFVYGPLAP